MNSKLLRNAFARLVLLAVGPLFLLILFSYSGAGSLSVAAEEDSTPVRRVNVPYMPDGVTYAKSAVFWFGRVDQQNNYVDVRIGYDNDKLLIRTAATDRRIWYNEQLNKNPNIGDLTNWDAVTLYLDTDNSGGGSPSEGDYRFVTQFSTWEPRTNYQAAYKGSGGKWVQTPFTITAKPGWRGHEPNTYFNDRGWIMVYEIPYAKLGLSGPPSKGTVWGLGMTLHDRDTAAGPPIPVKKWPEKMNGSQPATWGEIAFGLPQYSPPAAVQGGKATIRHKLNGAVVKDAHVGGSTTCGAPYGPNFFDGWGDANYAGAKQINIQNLGDIADWPCYSKVYLTFPLDSIPANQEILSAKLTMYQFGGSDVSKAQPSLIQVFTVHEAWNEGTITWNNAPLAGQNIAATWVYPIKDSPGWPGVPVTWDVSPAAAEANKNGADLRLALYDADWAIHSGKYFTSSDEADWGADARPVLEVEWGSPGYVFDASPHTRAIRSGASTSYTINVTHSPGLNENISLQAASPSNKLEMSISPATIPPPGGKSTLTVKSKHPASSTAGALFTIPIKASAGANVQQTSVNLLLNGGQSYLPMVRN